MCQGTVEGSVLEAGKLILKDYRWHEPLHQVIFDVLVAIPTDVPELIRGQLPARLTRKGFPDVEWEDLFKPHSLSKKEAERLMEQLCGLK